MARRARSPGRSPRWLLPRGMSLVEIVVAMGVVVLFTTSFVALIGTNYSRLELARDQSEAAFLLQEGANAVRNIATRSWTDIESATDLGTQGLSRAGTQYILNGTSDITTVSQNLVFTRTITVGRLYRDPPSIGNIIDPADYATTPNLASKLDADARLITINIAWTNEVKEPTSIQSIMVVSRWSKGSIIFDTLEDFSGDPTTNPPQLHNTTPVKELFNGEVRVSNVGTLRTPVAVGHMPVSGSTEPIIDVAVNGDDLFVLTKTSLRHASLANISLSKTITFDRTIATPAAASMALSANYIFVGEESGNVRSVPRADFVSGVFNSWPMAGVFSRGNYSASDTSPARRLFLSSDESVLYVGRDLRPGNRTYEFQAFYTSDGSLVPGQEVELGSSVTGITSNGAYAFVSTATEVNVFDMTQSALRVTTTFSPFLASQTITDVALDEGFLYVTGDANVNTPELVRIDVRDPNNPTSSSLELGTSARRVYIAPNPDWVAIVQDSSNAKILLVRKQGALSSFATADLSALSGGINLIGSTCRAISYEKDRMYFGCSAVDGSWHLVVLEDSTTTPVRHSDYASYVSPVKCAPGSVSRWEQLSYRESGQGIVSLQIRTGADAAATRAAAWHPTVYSDDSAWYNLNTLGLTGNCVQLRAVYQAAPDCPVFLEHAIFTFTGG